MDKKLIEKISDRKNPRTLEKFREKFQEDGMNGYESARIEIHEKNYLISK